MLFRQAKSRHCQLAGSCGERGGGPEARALLTPETGGSSRAGVLGRPQLLSPGTEQRDPLFTCLIKTPGTAS